MILVSPLLLILTTTLVFKYASKTFGKEKGYLIVFFYWFFWRLFIPWLLTRKGFTSLLGTWIPFALIFASTSLTGKFVLQVKQP
jgi:L-asparagine transporter-like permease